MKGLLSGWVRARASIVALLSCSAFCLYPGTSLATEASVITWYVSHLPPFFVTSGPKAKLGAADRLMYEELIPRLPDYQHTVESVPFARRAVLIRSDPSACVPAQYKTPERESVMYFSEPVILMLPVGAYVRAEDVKRVEPWLNSEGRLNLAAALSHGSLQVGAQRGRSYDPQVDELLTRRESLPNVSLVSNDTSFTSLLKMLDQGRISIALGMPYEAVDKDGVLTIVAEDYGFYQIQEAPSYSLGYVTCSKTAIGEAVIHSVNQLIRKHHLITRTNEFMNAWLPEPWQIKTQRAITRARADGAIRFGVAPPAGKLK